MIYIATVSVTKLKTILFYKRTFFFSFAMGVFGVHEFDVNFAVEIA